VCVRVCECVDACVHVCVWVGVCVCTCVCMYVCMYDTKNNTNLVLLSQLDDYTYYTLPSERSLQTHYTSVSHL